MDIHHYIQRFIQNPKTAYEKFLQMREHNSSFEMIFIRGDWYWLASRLKPNSTVIDIGARIGDTAIFFAYFPNTSKVIGYEPNPKIFKEAQKNVETSPLKGKIVLKQNAITAQPMEKRIEAKGYGYESVGYSFEDAKESTEGELVKSITLNQALKGLKQIVIRSNCEGAEATFFDDADLDEVYAIQLEYHKEPEHIQKVLESKGFKVKWHGRGGASGLMFAEK